MKTKEIEVYSVLSYILISMLLMLSVLPLVGAQETQNFFFTIHAMQDPPYLPEYGELLEEELAKIGINYVIELVDTATRHHRQVHMCTEYGYTWDEGGSDVGFPAYGWVRFDPGEIRLYVGSDYTTDILTIDREPTMYAMHRWFNGRVDKLLDESDHEIDIEKRKSIIMEIMEIVYDAQPYIPILWPKETYLMQKGIKDFLPRYGQGYFRGLYKISIEGKTLADDITLSTAQPDKILYPAGFFASGVHSWGVANVLYDTLIEFDNDMNPIVPCLAKSWEFSEDGKTLTFHLRDDVYWHDGVKFTSEDVKWTIETANNPETSYYYYSRFKKLLITSVSTPDEYTVVINLDTPNALALVRFGQLYIEAKHHWEGVNPEDMQGSELVTEGPYIGTGPFKFVEWRKGEYMEFEANKDYFQGEPIVDRLFAKIIPEVGTALAALEAGEVDMLSTRYTVIADLARLEEDPNINVLTFESGYMEAMMVNCQHPVLTNKWVRKAISYMIPREHIAKDIRKGLAEPANQIAPTWSIGHNADLPPIDYDLEKAKECMEKAGYDFDLLGIVETPFSNLLTYLVVGLICGGLAGAAVVYWRKRSK